MFRIYTPWNIPRRPHGAYTLLHVGPDNEPIPRAVAQDYAELKLIGVRDTASIFRLSDMFNSSKSDDSQRIRIVMKPRIKINLKNSAITNIQNSSVGSLTLGGRHRTTRVTKVTRKAPFFTFFSRSR